MFNESLHIFSIEIQESENVHVLRVTFNVMGNVTRVSVLLFKLECTINTIIYIYIYSDGFIFYVS